MKKLLIIILCFAASLSTRAQTLEQLIDSAKNYLDTNIVTNNTRQVTPLKLHNAINNLINALRKIDTSVVVVLGRDTFLVDPPQYIDTIAGKPHLKIDLTALGKVDTIYHRSDSVFYKVGSTEYFAFKDSTGGGGGTGWLLTGNTGTTTSDFFGTIDDKDIYIRRNNIHSGLISAAATHFGYYAGDSDVGAEVGTYFGAAAGRQNSGNAVTAIGYAAGYLNSGSKVTAVGEQAGYVNTKNNVSLFGHGAFADSSNQIVLSEGEHKVRLDMGYLDGDVKLRVPNTSGIIPLTVNGIPANTSGDIPAGGLQYSDTLSANGIATKSDIPWKKTGSDTYYNAGKVLIGAQLTPSALLQIAGSNTGYASLNIESALNPPTTPAEGDIWRSGGSPPQIRFSGSNHVFAMEDRLPDTSGAGNSYSRYQVNQQTGGNTVFRYKALIGQQSAASGITAAPLTVGQIYTIDTYGSGDDFDNFELISGTPNSSGAVYKALTTDPNNFVSSSLSHTSDPFAIVLQNTFGEELYYTTTSTGEYLINSGNGSFAQGRTHITIGGGYMDGTAIYNTWAFPDRSGSTSTINLQSTSGFTFSDDVLNQTAITIEVWP